MRILFICSADVWGGNEKWVAKTIEGLSTRHEVFFMGKAAHLHKRFGENIPAFFAPFKSVVDWKTRKIIADVARTNQIDIIISTKKKEYFLAGLVARKLGMKHIVRLGIVRKMRWPIWNKLVYKILNDGIIVNAHKIKHQLLQYSWMKNHPIAVIYNGLTSAGLSVKACESDPEIFSIVSTGMLTRRKGFHILIDAVARLTMDLQGRLQIHILGKGSEEAMLKELIDKKRLKEVVHMEGFCDPLPWLKRADLFCLLSRNEGVSNALLEAMDCGVPVLTTDAGGAGEFIQNGQNGFLVGREASEVAEALRQVMSMQPGQLNRMGGRGKDTVNTLFAPSRMVEEVEKFLHNFA